MPKSQVDYSIYYVTGRPLLPSPPATYTGPAGDWYLHHLDLALRAGVTVVQIREKDVDGGEFYEVARRSKALCDKYNVPLLINDRLDIALLLSCGLHVGQDDLPSTLARKLLGPDAILGVSVNTPQEMQTVLNEGVADYVGVGPCFGTQTKKNLNPIMGPRGVRDVLEVLADSPVKAVIIGGITPQTIPNVLSQTPAPLKSGGHRKLDGLAVVSTIAAATDPTDAVKELRRLWAEQATYNTQASGRTTPESVISSTVEMVKSLKAGEKGPLVHHITNQVVMNDCANLTLALSGSPIMSSSPDEAPSLSKLISCLLLNLGTITEAQITTQKIAGEAANRNGKPVVFDPVGVGATAYRKQSASNLLNACHVSIIKGNAGEIGALAGSSEVQARGVDSVGKGFKDPATIVKSLAGREKLVVAMSGETDYVSDGTTTFAIENGSHWQGKITGSGCMATSSVAVFAGLNHSSGALAAAVAGLLAINVAAELAEARPDVQGPNTFRAALIDSVYALRPEDIEQRARVSMLSFLANELGFNYFRDSHSTYDVILLLLSRFIRMIGFGVVAPVLILYLRAQGFSDRQVGLFLTLTLLGDVLVSLAVTWTGDLIGRRRTLALGSLLMGGAGLVFCSSSSPVLLLLAAIVGIISPSGNEIGPFAAIEQAAVSQLTTPDGRVSILMWYQVLGFAGVATGNSLAGLIVDSLERRGRLPVDAYRGVFVAYASVAMIKILLSFAMTNHTEVDHPPVPTRAQTDTPSAPRADSERQPLLADQARVRSAPGTESLLDPPTLPAPPPGLPVARLVILAAIFSLDSFASSLIPLSFISYYFRTQFSASVATITHTFSTTAVISCFSQLAAGSISKRAGIIGTMVGTHMPAQLLTMSLAFAPNLTGAITIFIARSFIASMDSSVRGAFLAAVVPKESRTRFLGIINVCKTLASAPGPTLSGQLASLGGLRWSFVITASIKLIYDICLFIGFKTAKLEH
ncbi:hypothetical protein JCM10212_001737 [Sporobolomyces blumeae]